MNTYSSIVPSEMTNRELLHMCMELQTAKNWNAETITVRLASNGMEYRVNVSDLPDYQQAYRTEAVGLN